MIALALMLAAAAGQAKPAAKAPAKPAAARPAGPQISMNISPAGQAVIKKYLASGPDAEMVALAKQLQSVAVETKALGAADKLDMAKLEQLLRQQEQLQAQLRKRSDDRLIAMLNELSEADRLGFARGTVSVSAQARPAQPKAAPSR